jgi:demethylspheroidene O-methyltransferase
MVDHPYYAGSPLRRLLSAFHAFRSRQVASREFRDFAARFPLTRPIAHRNASRLFDLTAGFVYSQALSAAVALDLFDRMARHPQSTADIAEIGGMPVSSAHTLMRALASLDLAHQQPDGRYGLGTLGAALVDNPGVIAMIRHHGLLYRDLTDPLALLRTPKSDTELRRFWNYRDAEGSEDDAAARYSDLMAASQSFISAEIFSAYPIHNHSVVLDVGGGDGSFLLAVAGRTTKARLVLFDLPAVAMVARQRLAAHPLGHRIDVHGGSVFSDALPVDADLVTLNRVLHDHDDGDAQRLLTNLHRSMSPDSRLLLSEPMSETDGTSAMADAYFGFYLLAIGQGRPRSADEIETMLETAGFKKIRALQARHPLLSRSILATR